MNYPTQARIEAVQHFARRLQQQRLAEVRAARERAGHLESLQREADAAAQAGDYNTARTLRARLYAAHRSTQKMASMQNTTASSDATGVSAGLFEVGSTMSHDSEDVAIEGRRSTKQMAGMDALARVRDHQPTVVVHAARRLRPRLRAAAVTKALKEARAAAVAARQTVHIHLHVGEEAQDETTEAAGWLASVVA